MELEEMNVGFRELANSISAIDNPFSPAPNIQHDDDRLTLAKYLKDNFCILYTQSSPMDDGRNANPVIRNDSDLPTRRPRTSSSGPKSSLSAIFSSTIPYLSDPLYEHSSSSEQELDDDNAVEPIDEQEIYDLISTISDPEHPLSLGSLAVVNLPDIHIVPLGRDLQTVLVEITPTITHCSLATVIGLGVRVRLEQSLPPRFRVDVKIKDGSHSTGESINKQLKDKERVAAALENASLTSVLKKMLETCR